MSRTFRQRSFLGALWGAVLAISLSGCDGGAVEQRTIETPDENAPVTDQPAADPPVDMTLSSEPETSQNAPESDFQVPPDIDSAAPAEQPTEGEPSFSLPPVLNQPEN